MTMIAFIPARGGSQRVPGKNLALVGGRSLLARAIDCAHAADLHAVVSTESDEIAAVAAALGAEVHARPIALASATAQIEPSIHAWLRSDPRRADDVRAIALLQPTSPFRRPETVRECVRAVLEDGCDSALTVHVDAHRAFFWGRLRGDVVRWERDCSARPRTQDLQPDAIENGCVYAFTRQHLLTTRCRMGGKERAIVIDSVEALDIDTPGDLELARAIATLREGRAA